MSDPAPPAWLAPLRGRRGLALAFAWGLAEGTFFFLLPDILYTLVALFDARRALHLVGAVLAGALLAGAAMHLWAATAPDSAVAAVDAVPFVQIRMLEAATADYARAGVWAPCLGPLSGIPYKVYAVLAPPHVSLVPFLLVTIPARLERLLLTWALFATVGWLARRPVAAHPSRAALAHAGFWACATGWYWLTVAAQASAARP